MAGQPEWWDTTTRAKAPTDIPSNPDNRPLYTPAPTVLEPKEKTSWSPSVKLATAIGGGGSLAIILQWVTQQAGVEMPEPVALAFASLLIGVVGYFTPER